MKIIINKETIGESEFKSWKGVALRFIKMHKFTYKVQGKETLTKHNNGLIKVCPKCGKLPLSEIEDGVYACEAEDCIFAGKRGK